MKKSDFYFDLPEELIAQTPLEKRDASRLMCLDRVTARLRTESSPISWTCSIRAIAW